ncbi:MULTISPECIES: DedA family protein [unclassified Modicisalibacter]|uniref:YqaA family protein n=1 Tax=unclassified Modicisalibacter TaxID=2679913 RepID=UPI001CCDF3E1|nr:MULTISPECIES: DedA family protein [unclassified Modicisalibacter]MBZ9559381.1 VTT domain-containing protein [Modicisalibacter sp. R2A 31.J]MBZ9576454.1 VTT domain-containing protein [Modicisalibacter sp. MOD 31.J]
MPLPRSLRSLASATAWLDRLAASRHALVVLFVASMLETLLVPIPIELILIPWMMTHPAAKWRLAAVALAGNLSAALLGYALGGLAIAQWGDTLIPLFGGQAAYDAFAQRVSEDGFQAIVAVGITPVPFQIAMLVAGASDYPLPLFLLAALLARGVRYFGLAVLVAVAGEHATRLWKRHARPVGAFGLVAFAVWGYWQIAQ